MFCCFFKKKLSYSSELNSLYKKIRDFYFYEELKEDRKKYLADTIAKYGYLPYPYIKALEELTPAEVIFALEQKLKLNNVFNENEFIFNDDEISPVKRAGISDSAWINKEQHNIKLVNLAGLADGNKTQETGKFIDWLRQILILPSGNFEKGVLSTTIYLIPFHPREFGCAYLPTSSGVSANLVDKELKSKLSLGGRAQIQTFIKLAQLAGHPVIYDVLPQTGRFSKMVLSRPSIARWYDINYLIVELEKAIVVEAEKMKAEHDEEDVEIVKNILKTSIKSGSTDLSDYYKEIFKKLDDSLVAVRKELSNKMLLKSEQQKIHKKVEEIVAKTHQTKSNKISKENDIISQGETIKELISQGFWPAPGGAWCSAGVPVFEKMSECGGYPIFRHYDFKGQDVSHFANLDCQTPFYFAHLESGEFNNEVIDYCISHFKELQKDYNFDGFRVDHIDHIVDEISEKDKKPRSYRAPRAFLARLNRSLKSVTPHFATIAEYMLWDKFYEEYHQDMGFDLLWGNDIISQFAKTPLEIVENNQELCDYNKKNLNLNDLSIMKSYNNQDGEFRAIDQYPGQLGEDGAIFKWFKYKFLPGGKNAQRPVMFIDGDESFTKTGIEGVICAEVSMPREHNQKFFERFDAINRFALNNDFTSGGEAQIIKQDDDGFVAWFVSKDPLKECLLVVANYKSPAEKIMKEGEDGVPQQVLVTGMPVLDKSVELPCDYRVLGEFVLEGEPLDFVEKEVTLSNKLTFEKLEPSEFRVFKLTR